MKLAEALSHRARLTEKVSQLRVRLLARRDVLAMKAKTLGEALKVLTEREDRYNRNEIRFVRTVDVKDFRHIYDRSAAELRELDLKIQAVGWTTELVEK